MNIMYNKRDRLLTENQKSCFRKMDRIAGESTKQVKEQFHESFEDIPCRYFLSDICPTTDTNLGYDKMANENYLKILGVY